MATEEDGHSESRSIVQIYSDFMTRVSIFEELLPIGSRLLIGFQQALGFLGRPPINKTSALADGIMKSHVSERVLSYVEAGCMNPHDSAQHVNESTTVVNELEHLLDDAASAVIAANSENEDDNHNIDFSCDEEELSSSKPFNPRATDYAATMANVYSMIKQDYTMQARIVSSLSLKTSIEQLETYCQMWSLRPFVDDDVMREAWGLVR